MARKIFGRKREEMEWTGQREVSWSVPLTIQHPGDQIKEDKGTGVCGMYGETEKCCRVLVGKT